MHLLSLDGTSVEEIFIHDTIYTCRQNTGEVNQPLSAFQSVTVFDRLALSGQSFGIFGKSAILRLVHVSGLHTI